MKKDKRKIVVHNGILQCTNPNGAIYKMKNKLLIFLLLISSGAFAQNRMYNLTTQFDSVKVRKLIMTSIIEGGSTDSVLVKKPNGGIFKVSQASLSSQVVEITGTSQSGAVNRIYIPHNASLTTITAPSASVIGSLVQVVGEGSGGWRVQLPAGYTAKGVGISTTSGGSLSSTDRYCTITLRLAAANTFVVTSSQGTITPN